MSGASAFAAATHPKEGFASVFVTAPDGLTLHLRSYGLAPRLRFQSCAYLVSLGLQPTFIPSQRRWRPTLPIRGVCSRSITAAMAGPNTISIPTTTRRFVSPSPISRQS